MSPLLLLLLLVSACVSAVVPLVWVLQWPLLSSVFSIESWDSLSGYVHPGITCLAFQAFDWLGAFWTSLSDYPPLLGVYPSVTFC